MDSHLHRLFLNEHNHGEVVKIDALCRFLRKIERPQQPCHHKAQFDPSKRSPQAAVEPETEGLACGELVVGIFRGLLAVRQPAFGDELIGVVEVSARAVDGEGADADSGLRLC